MHEIWLVWRVFTHTLVMVLLDVFFFALRDTKWFSKHGQRISSKFSLIYLVQVYILITYRTMIKLTGQARHRRFNIHINSINYLVQLEIFSICCHRIFKQLTLTDANQIDVTA